MTLYLYKEPLEANLEQILVYLWQRIFELQPFKLSDRFEIDTIFGPTAIWMSEILFETRLWHTIYFF